VDHLVQPPWRSRVTYSRLHRTLSRWGLNISREGDSTTSLGSLFQGSVTLRVEEVLPHVQLELPVLQFVSCPCCCSLIWGAAAGGAISIRLNKPSSAKHCLCLIFNSIQTISTESREMKNVLKCLCWVCFICLISVNSIGKQVYMHCLEESKLGQIWYYIWQRYS